MADDLISRQALLEQIRLMANRVSLGETSPANISGLEVCGLILGATAVDAVEVVHGHWEYGKWEQGHWVKGNERCRCSVCHRDFAVDNSNIWHGCPQCLAKMDGERRGEK